MYIPTNNSSEFQGFPVFIIWGFYVALDTVQVISQHAVFLLKTFIKLFKLTQEARFDWKRFVNIYKIAEDMKVMLETFILKCLINSTYKMLKQHC